GDRVFDQNPERTQTDLARIVELLDGQANGQVEVRVCKDHERRLAAELKGQGHDVRGRGLGDHAGSRDGAGERQPTDTWVCGQRRSGLSAGALYDVEHASRQSSLVGDVG